MNNQLSCFAFEVLYLISSGKKEKWGVIEEKISQNKLATYIVEKYGNEFSGDLDLEQLNAIFANYAGCIDGVEDRKYGIKKEDDGLLVIIALIIKELSK